MAMIFEDLLFGGGNFAPIKSAAPPGPADITRPLVGITRLQVPSSIHAPAANGRPGVREVVTVRKPETRTPLPVQGPAPGAAAAPVSIASATRPAGASKPAAAAGPTGAEAMNRLIAMYEERYRQNAAMLEAARARLAGKSNPFGSVDAQGNVTWTEGAGRELGRLQGEQAGQGSRAAAHAKNDAVKQMMAGGGLVTGAHLANTSDNFQAGVALAQQQAALGQLDKLTNWDQWQTDLDMRLATTDPFSSQLSDLIGQTERATLLPGTLANQRQAGDLAQVQLDNERNKWQATLAQEIAKGAAANPSIIQQAFGALARIGGGIVGGVGGFATGGPLAAAGGAVGGWNAGGELADGLGSMFAPPVGSTGQNLAPQKATTPDGRKVKAIPPVGTLAKVGR